MRDMGLHGERGITAGQADCLIPSPVIFKDSCVNDEGSRVPVNRLGNRYWLTRPAVRLPWISGAVAACMLHLSAAWAGGGPETTLVVVNAASPLSLTIANAYVRMRDIPVSHVVWLDNVPAAGTIDIDAFRARIWKPIRDHIASHGLEEEIDTIAYSADFPYRVDFTKDIKANNLDYNRYRGRHASLTGLTYFGRLVENGDLRYLGGNYYFRRDLAPKIKPPRAPSEQEVTQIKEATNDLEHEKYQEAVESLQSAVKAYPWSANAWYQLARGLAALERIDEAINTLSKAVDLGWSHSLTARDDRLFDTLRSHPGFADMIRRMQLKRGPFQPAHGFRNYYIWTGGEEPAIAPSVNDVPSRYYLSTLLAYTGMRGNSVPEILSYLQLAKDGDGKFPKGTVYLMENSDIRSKTREGYFYATAAALTRRGHRVEILSKGDIGEDGILPKGKDDVIGAVVGAQRYFWNRSGSRLLPGAIAESLTSYGGDFDNFKQTKLSEFLRYGAAGSSGAVAEPYSIQAKFPAPSLHIHYADGSSLAEAFYQSIEAPYQLIVVGDPLARPFAHFAEIGVEESDGSTAWHDAVLIKPQAKTAAERPVHHFELWVDGQLADQVAPWDAFLWDTNEVEDGCHDVRLVAVEGTALETRSYLRLPVVVNNNHHQLKLDSIKKPVVLGSNVTLAGSAQGAQRIEVLQGGRTLASAQVPDDGHWAAAVPSQVLGLGEVSLSARAYYPDGSTARSCEAVIQVDPPVLLRAVNKFDADYERGLLATVWDRSDDDRTLIVKDLDGDIRELKNEENTVVAMQFDGEVNVIEPGFYQLVIATKGRLTVKFDGQSDTEITLSAEQSAAYLPLNLGSGWHSLQIDLVPEGRPYIKAYLAGETVATSLDASIVRHETAP